MERLPPTFTVPEHVLARRIGAGSSGEVWLARDSLGSWRAVKVVCRGVDGDESALRRELEGLRRYEPVSRSHPALLDILFTGTDPATGTLYYVMELADDASGTPAAEFAPATYQSATLGRRFRLAAQAAAPEDRRMPSAEVLSLALALAEGLAHLHAAGLIHRDIKPGNVVFLRGRPCLADCGLVSTSAVARSFVGTEGFIPPEGPGTPAADVYALGKVIYEAAFGLDRNDWPELPVWFGTTPDAPLLRELRAVTLRACANDPDVRYCDAGEMLADLKLLTTGGSVVRQGERRNRRRWFALAALLMATFAGIAFWSNRRPPLVAEALSTRLSGLHWIQPVNLSPQGEPQLGFFGVSGSEIQLIGMQGDTITHWAPADNPVENLRLEWLADLNGDGSLELWPAWNSGTNCVIAATSQFFRQLRRYVVPGVVGTDERGNSLSLSSCSPAFIADLDGDGKQELIATLNTEKRRNFPNAPTLREILSFDLDTGRINWRVSLTAPLAEYLTVVSNHAGGVALLAGGGAPGNGHHLADGTDDDHSQLFAIGADGKLLWHRPVAGEYTASDARTITWPADGVTEFYARGRANDDAREDHSEVGRILRFDVGGNELNRREFGNELNSWHVTDLDRDGTPELIVTDSHGMLHVLSRELETLKQIRIASLNTGQTRVEIEFIGEADLDGDGRAELLFSVVQCKRVSFVNSGNVEGGKNSWKFTGWDLLVLNRNLKVVARHRIADRFDRFPSGDIRLFDLEGKGHPFILVLSVNPQILRWRK